MSESLHPQSPGIDPSLQQPVAERSAEQIKLQYGVTEEQLRSGAVLETDISQLDALAEVQLSDGSSEAMLSVLRPGQAGTEWQIWARVLPGGIIDKSQVRLTNADYQPGVSPSDTYVEVNAGDRAVPLGRNYKNGLKSDSTISRTHADLKLGTDGKLALTDQDSSHGTKVLSRQSPVAKPSENLAVGADIEDTLVPERKAGPRENERFKSVHNDPEFVKLTADHRAALAQNQEFYKSEQERLQAKIDEYRRSDQTKLPAVESQLAKLRANYEAAQTKLRAELEEVVKPYLAERLHFFDSDHDAAYARPEQLYYDRTQRKVIIAATGKVFARYLPNQVAGREGIFVPTTASIRLGQITQPSRLGSWGGSNNQKANHKTGETTTSRRHIVDLAAAMVAGNMSSAHEPIRIQRDTHAEFFLPKELQGKVPLYKVVLGMHRIAAQRLLEGIDASVSYDELID